MLLWLVSNEDLRRGDIAHDVKPLWEFGNLAIGLLVESRLPHPQGCEVVFTHCRIRGGYATEMGETGDQEGPQGDNEMKHRNL